MVLGYEELGHDDGPGAGASNERERERERERFETFGYNRGREARR
jgi:hypothetical protein